MKMSKENQTNVLLSFFCIMHLYRFCSVPEDKISDLTSVSGLSGTRTTGTGDETTDVRGGLSPEPTVRCPARVPRPTDFNLFAFAGAERADLRPALVPTAECLVAICAEMEFTECPANNRWSSRRWEYLPEAP